MQRQNLINNVVLGCWGVGIGALLYKYFPWHNYVAVGGLGFCAVALALLKRYYNGGVNKFYPQYHNVETVVITGANTGLGRICTEEIAKLNPAHVVMACRNR